MGRRMYASELSDGTLRTIAIFLPLVDPSYTVVVIEEPENCIHPWVIRQFVDAAREYSGKKQIILTTHSPILVSRLTPSELFVADRRAGESEILPATEVEDAKVQDIVRKGIMDLGAYWDSGAMRAVPVQPTLFEGVEK
jgi:predicted ATPase